MAEDEEPAPDTPDGMKIWQPRLEEPGPIFGSGGGIMRTLPLIAPPGRIDHEDGLSRYARQTMKISPVRELVVDLPARYYAWRGYWLFLHSHLPAAPLLPQTASRLFEHREDGVLNLDPDNQPTTRP